MGYPYVVSLIIFKISTGHNHTKGVGILLLELPSLLIINLRDIFKKKKEKKEKKKEKLFGTVGTHLKPDKHRTKLE